MSTVSVTQINPDDEITSAGANLPHNQLAAVINGNLDDNNIASISGTKIINGTLPPQAIVAGYGLAFTGMILPYVARVAPSGWLNADGSAVSRTTYANLFSVIVPSLGIFTITIASPGVVTKTAHGLSTGDSVYLTTTGALPTGLVINTLYYVIRVDANTFRLASSRANAIAGTAINTTGSQSGTHTVLDCPYGLGDGSTTFNLPDARGRVLAGMDTTSGTAASRLTLARSQGTYGNLGATGGAESHQLIIAELASHNHGIPVGGQQKPQGTGGITAASIDPSTSSATGGDTAHNNVQPTILTNYIIKT
ncbi:tail fiber protein [Mycobacteroides abscessus]|uniref:tail fiber protein n=1 Tax=Mycobacteroides abscessus TaxID=36809 RepID=UPI00092A9202|nr:tail fiber protein [Mycobacteroides abscessus]SIC58356.1 Phage Tail Collar Domain [Mycobacteroides abscessus subsp. abscessus]